MTRRPPTRPTPALTRRLAAVGAGLLLVTACGTTNHHRAATTTTVPAPTPGPTASTAPAATSTTARPITRPATTLPAATTTTGASAATGPGAALPLHAVTVVVDPGHNGANGSHPAEINRPVNAGGFQKPCNTTGTAEGSVTEATVNLQMARHLQAALEALGARVVLTRSDNAGWGPCVDQRGLLARQVGAAALVSLHADGAGAGRHGFHVIHPGSIAGYTDAIVDSSARLATFARDGLVAAGFQPSNYVGQAGLIERTDLGTLNRAGVPAIMLEAGNMHDPGDLGLVTSPAAQDRIAHALALAVVQLLHR